MSSDHIKIYNNVNREDDTIIFDLKRMEDVYDKTGGQVDDPHRHGYYTILCVRHAAGKHVIDFNEFKLNPYQIYFIEPGQVHQIIERERSQGFVLTFSPQFLLINGIDQDLIKDIFIYEVMGYSPPLELDLPTWNTIISTVELVEKTLQSSIRHKYEAVGALLKYFLIQCNNSCNNQEDDNTQQVQSSIQLVRSFKKLLEDQFSRYHKVSSYASELHVTPDYLNTVLKSATGKSAKSHISDRIMMEAKRLFLFTDMSIKEVGYQLGFNEPAHFSSFFKKYSGQSPSAYLRT